MIYESAKGDIFYADCRPSFRARYLQSLSPWALTEFDEEGGAIVHGNIEGSDKEILFELQNLTEIGLRVFRGKALQIGLCGLAFQAKVAKKKSECVWTLLGDSRENEGKSENIWHLNGEILEFRAFQNPLSKENLFWIYIDLDGLKLEILVNRKQLTGAELAVGLMLKADIWLQGHVIPESAFYSRFEGIDPRTETADFWRHLRRKN